MNSMQFGNNDLFGASDQPLEKRIENLQKHNSALTKRIKQVEFQNRELRRELLKLTVKKVK